MENQEATETNPMAGATSPPPAVPEKTPSAAGRSGEASGLDFVLDVPLRVTVEVGGARMLVRDVLQLAKGSVVELDRMSGEPADVLVNGRLVARGEITVAEDRLAVRLVEVVGPEGLGRALR